MFPWQDFLELISLGFIHAAFSPIFWLILFFVGWRYYTIAQSRSLLIGKNTRRDVQGIAFSVLLGLFGGWLGSVIMGFLGLSLSELNLSEVWLTALLLMFVHPRFICFAYGGSLLILSSLIIGWPHINGPILLGLVGSLHLVESILITISGKEGALPIWIKHPRTKEWVLGYRMEHFWPLPLLMLIAEPIPLEEMAGYLTPTLGWWPLFPLQTSLETGYGWIFSVATVGAALGYMDLAVGQSPSQKSRESGLGLFVYSLILIAIAVGSVHYSWLLPVGALFSALGHEALIQIGTRREWKKEPLLQADWDRFLVVMVEDNSLADRLGVMPGDQIVSLSDYSIGSPDDLREALFWSPSKFTLEWIHQGKKERSSGSFTLPGAQRTLGVLALTPGLPIPYMSGEVVPLGEKIWRKFKNY